MAEKSNLVSHPFILFWLGLLTGALIVGLLFSYKAMSPMNPDDYESSLFRFPSVRYIPITTSIGDPSGNLDPNLTLDSSLTLDPSRILDLNAIGDPSGN